MKNKLVLTMEVDTKIKVTLKSNADEVRNAVDKETEMDKETFRFYQNGTTITCVMTDECNYKGIGVAMCNPSDEFDLEDGIVLSELRARADMYNNYAKSYAKRL